MLAIFVASTAITLGKLVTVGFQHALSWIRAV